MANSNDMRDPIPNGSKKAVESESKFAILLIPCHISSPPKKRRRTRMNAETELSYTRSGNRNDTTGDMLFDTFFM